MVRASSRTRSRRGLEREDELRDVVPLLARVELLLGVLVLGGVLDQEAVVRAARVHRLDERRDVPLAVAGARGRRRPPMPAVAGAFAQVTPPSVQEPPSRKAWRVRWLPEAEDAYRRSLAVSRTQPAGIVGRSNRTSARRFAFPLLDMTLRIESPPLFDDGLLCSIQASATDGMVCAEPQFAGVAAGLDRPQLARRRLVDVAGRVGRPHLEGVLADGQVRVGLRRGARGERRRVERALERRTGLRATGTRSSRSCWSSTTAGRS